MRAEEEREKTEKEARVGREAHIYVGVNQKAVGGREEHPGVNRRLEPSSPMR